MTTILGNSLSKFRRDLAKTLAVFVKFVRKFSKFTKYLVKYLQRDYNTEKSEKFCKKKNRNFLRVILDNTEELLKECRKKVWKNFE